MFCTCTFFLFSQSSKKSLTREDFLKSAYGKENISLDEINKLNDSKEVVKAYTDPSIHKRPIYFHDPKYDKYSDRITSATPNKELIYQRLEREAKERELERRKKLMQSIAKYLLSILTVSFIVILILKKYPITTRSKRIVNELSNYDDNTLSKDELHTAQILYELKEKINEPEYKDLFEKFGENAIDEVSLKIFKFGIWRLLDVKYANHLFNNKAYVEVGKQKMITDINKRFKDEEFLNMTKEEVDSYVLKWVLKTRDDAQGVKNIMSSLKTEK